MADPNISSTQLSEDFMKDFNLKKGSLKSRIDTLAPNGDGNMEQQLAQVTADIQTINKLLHDASMFLPSYSIKIRQSEIRDLERVLKEKEESLIPKKKFGFKSKLTQAAPAIQPEKTKAVNIPHVSKTSAQENNFFTIEKKQNATVCFGENELNNNDVMVKDLEDCTIVLEGAPSTLRLANLKRCRLLCGPVKTSVFVDHVIDSCLYLCCQQLRTHSSKDVDVYLRVVSRAIIEDCSNIRFGPYIWDSDKSEHLHRDSEIDPNLERYDAVDDFNWLSATHSPNWSIIPEEDRKTFHVA